VLGRGLYAPPNMLGVWAEGWLVEVSACWYEVVFVDGVAAVGLSWM